MLSIYASALVKEMVKKGQLMRYLYGFMITDYEGYTDRQTNDFILVLIKIYMYILAEERK